MHVWNWAHRRGLSHQTQQTTADKKKKKKKEHIRLSDVELMISKGIKYEILLDPKPDKSARVASRQAPSIISLLWLWLFYQIWSIDHEIKLHRSHQEISPCDPEGHLGQMVPLQPACWQGFTVCHQSDFSSPSLMSYCWDDVRTIVEMREA